MILLDTNVVSELMSVPRDSTVNTWFRQQPKADLIVSAITVAEIQYGLCRLPLGKRRKGLAENFAAFMERAFAGRILSFDAKAAYAYGPLAAGRRAAGFNTGPIDLLIAAIARSRDASIATRNARDFEGCGITLINPWAAG